MIKNVIFDLGQVLYRFEPLELSGEYTEDESVSRLLSEVVFDRLYWDRLDLGTIEDEELIELACERLPQELHALARKTYYNCFHNMPKVPGMQDVITRVKKAGRRVFLLSNISKHFSRHSADFDLLSEFEFCVFSADIGMVKPSREIFEYILNKAGINAEETLFIDDSEKNLRGAELLGIHTYLFDGNAEKLSEYLEKEIKE